MREDLIERITTMIFNNIGITELVLTLCEIATNDEQRIFEKRLKEAADLNLTPFDLNVSKYFILDYNSNILDFLEKQFKVPED